MDILIRLLKLIGLIITIYPGIIIVIEKMNGKCKRLKDNHQYSLALVVVVLFDSLIYKTGFEILVILGSACTVIFLEYLVIDNNRIKYSDLKYEIKSLYLSIFVMIICPVFEELIYRFYLHKYVVDCVGYQWIFCILSFFSFLFCHFSTQQIKALNKIPFTVVVISIYLLYDNIYICIVFHMIYNIMVYNYNIGKYMRKPHY